MNLQVYISSLLIALATVSFMPAIPLTGVSTSLHDHYQALWHLIQGSCSQCTPNQLTRDSFKFLWFLNNTEKLLCSDGVSLLGTAKLSTEECYLSVILNDYHT